MNTTAPRDAMLPARVAMAVIRATQLLSALILMGLSIYGLSTHGRHDSMAIGPAIGLPVVSTPNPRSLLRPTSAHTALPHPFR